MFIELENLFNGGITEVPLDFEFDFSGEEIDGVFPFTTPVKLQGKVENVAEIVEVKATAVSVWMWIAADVLKSLNSIWKFP